MAYVCVVTMGCRLVKGVRHAHDEKHCSLGRCSTPSWGNSLLDQNQKKMILATWTILNDSLMENGQRVFQQIFYMRSGVKKLFPFRDVDGEDLWNHPSFKAHALHFMQAIGAAVDNLDDLDGALSPILLDLGARHYTKKGFGLQYFEVFTKALLVVWNEQLGEDFTPEVKAAWEKTFIFILMNLRDGYQLERDRQQIRAESILFE